LRKGLLFSISLFKRQGEEVSPVRTKKTRFLSEIFKGFFIDYRSVSDKIKHILSERKGE